MRGHTIFLFASLALPIIATPVPTDHIDALEAVVERRSEFSITQLYRDLFKREALIEALPVQASYEVADKTKRITSEDSVEVGDNEEVAETADKRAVYIPAGGVTQRGRPGMNVGGGGPSKRGRPGMNVSGGGPSKRGRPGMNVGGGGPSKRGRPGMNVSGGGPSKRGRPGMNVSGGGPSKRGRPGMNVSGGGPTKRGRPGMNVGGGGPHR